MTSVRMSFQALAWNLWSQVDEQYTADQTKANQREPIRYERRGNEDP